MNKMLLFIKFLTIVQNCSGRSWMDGRTDRPSDDARRDHCLVPIVLLNCPPTGKGVINYCYECR